MDGLSSPRFQATSSSARPSSPSAAHRPPPAINQQAANAPVDPLALNAGGPPGEGGPDDEGDDESDDEGAARRGARRRVRGMQEDIPRVTDATGEAVMNSFQTFLET